MRHLGTSKIGKLTAKKDKFYAQIRLPSQLADTIGGIADIFETEHDGRRAFLLVTNDNVLDSDRVLQPDTKVVKLDNENHYNKRLTALERDMNDIKTSIYQKASSQSNNQKTKGRGRDSNPRRGLHRAIG